MCDSRSIKSVFALLIFLFLPQTLLAITDVFSMPSAPSFMSPKGLFRSDPLLIDNSKLVLPVEGLKVLDFVVPDVEREMKESMEEVRKDFLKENGFITKEDFDGDDGKIHIKIFENAWHQDEDLPGSSQPEGRVTLQHGIVNTMQTEGTSSGGSGDNKTGEPDKTIVEGNGNGNENYQDCSVSKLLELAKGELRGLKISVKDVGQNKFTGLETVVASRLKEMLNKNRLRVLKITLETEQAIQQIFPAIIEEFWRNFSLRELDLSGSKINNEQFKNAVLEIIKATGIKNNPEKILSDWQLLTDGDYRADGTDLVEKVDLVKIRDVLRKKVFALQKKQEKQLVSNAFCYGYNLGFRCNVEPGCEWALESLKLERERLVEFVDTVCLINHMQEPSVKCRASSFSVLLFSHGMGHLKSKENVEFDDGTLAAARVLFDLFIKDLIDKVKKKMQDAISRKREYLEALSKKIGSAAGLEGRHRGHLEYYEQPDECEPKPGCENQYEETKRSIEKAESEHALYLEAYNNMMSELVEEKSFSDNFEKFSCFLEIDDLRKLIMLLKKRILEADDIVPYKVDGELIGMLKESKEFVEVVSGLVFGGVKELEYDCKLDKWVRVEKK